jgi:glycolate oxidase FAD binding subunit
MDLTAFAAEVGTDAPVTIAGRSTRGGAVADVRCVRAPAGIESFQPDEMTVSCGAGTPVDELQAALAEHAQFVALPEGGTVGGALAVGRAGILRLGHGPVRDTVLQCYSVLADGAVVMAGGPTVKNVSGFDLCRLFVGAHGTLGFFGAVVLRTRPVPQARRWFSTPAEPWGVRRALYRPSSLLWDGLTTWVCLEGHPSDIDEQADAADLAEVDGPPPLPSGGRRVLEPERQMTTGSQGQTADTISRSAKCLLGKGRGNPLRQRVPARRDLYFESIILSDDRERICDTDLAPWRMICSLEMRLVRTSKSTLISQNMYIKVQVNVRQPKPCRVTVTYESKKAVS